MRLFLKQGNIIETSPAIDHISKQPRTDLTIVFALYDEGNTLVPNSTLTLASAGNGVYRSTLPELSILSGKYQAELDVSFGSTRIYYFKGPINALVRSKFDV